MPIHLKLEVKSTRFHYLWLKYVTGFDVSKHCAKCLLGKYSKMIPFRQYYPGSVFERDLDEHEAPFMYLCGVTSVHDENLHVAMRYAPGQIIEYEDANIKVIAQDAERLPIEHVDLPLPKEFTTCRNFQFGYHYFP